VYDFYNKYKYKHKHKHKRKRKRKHKHNKFLNVKDSITDTIFDV